MQTKIKSNAVTYVTCTEFYTKISYSLTVLVGFPKPKVHDRIKSLSNGINGKQDRHELKCETLLNFAKIHRTPNDSLYRNGNVISRVRIVSIK